MSRKILFAVALLTTLAPAAAYAGPDGKSDRVHHDDLNLMSAAGRAQLDKRVAAATKRVCATHGSRDLETIAWSRACLKTAMASARSQVTAALGSAEARFALAGGTRADGPGS